MMAAEDVTVMDYPSNQKTKIQKRWDTAREVASKLGIKPKAAWKLLKKLEFHELLESILDGVDEAIELGYELAEESKPKQSSLQRNASDVKLMLWAFDKIGDIERIKVAYRKALKVVQ